MQVVSWGEFDNSEDNANHIHSVWRDPENDFRDELLTYVVADSLKTAAHGHEHASDGSHD